MKLFVLLSLLAISIPATAAEAKKPNIIFMLADDLGIPGIGCYGGAYKTPNIDALAKSGTRFQYCFAAPLCAPSRAMLMTGRYAFRTGVKDNGLGAQATPEKDGCVAQYMKQAGYSTAVAGKWRQLTYFTTKEDGAKWGFDEFLIWGAGSPEEGESEGRKKKKDADGNKSKPDRYWNPDYNLNGKPLPDSEGKYGPDVLQQFVLDFVRRHKDGPFFVYYPTPLIHAPIMPTPDDKAGGEKKMKNKKDAGKATDESLYGGNIHYLDKLVGQLTVELDKLGIRENTLFVFSGDNGSVPVGTIDGRDIEGHKHTMLEGGSRVPLIASWPGTTPAGKVLKDLVDFSDMLPTFCELGGATPNPAIKRDGHSFAAQLCGQSGTPREWAYVQLGANRYVRTERWKLTGEGELFDMRDAPYVQSRRDPESADEDATTARKTLQGVLDSLKDDSVADAAKKKRKKKAK